MVNQWMKDHELVQHEELASLQPGPAKQFSLSPCAKLGTCVCGPKGKEFLLMWHKLRSHLKEAHPGTQKKPSSELVRYKEGLVVLELASEEIHDLLAPGSGREAGSETVYLHLGFTNFSTWETACTRLLHCFYNPFTGSWSQSSHDAALFDPLLPFDLVEPELGRVEQLRNVSTTDYY